MENDGRGWLRRLEDPWQGHGTGGTQPLTSLESPTKKCFYHLYQGDCLRVLPTLEDESVDLVVTDPPYGKFSIGGKNLVKAKEYASPTWDSSSISFKQFNELKRVSKHQIIFGYNYATEIYGTTNNLIVWDKKVKNDWFDTFSDGEIIYTSIKTPLRIYRQRWMGLLRNNKTETEKKRVHPTQKPVKLIEWLLNHFSQEDDVILDPFLGSGTTMEACQNLNRSCVGVEIEPKYCDIVKKRCFGRHFLDREVDYKFTVWEGS